MTYHITDKLTAFVNNVDYCVGTGRMGLALQKSYFDQLKLVQEEIGFKHIRGHGLFCDDMAIYHETPDDSPEYNFTYLDTVIDRYLELGIRPFLELGFSPLKMASGTQTVFYWKGNVTPPDYTKWAGLVAATLRHFIERYGEDEAVAWPVEVWNEPNLGIFWANADLDEYLKLFTVTIAAVKAVDARFRVGGPAICGIDDIRWLKRFLEFCRDEKLPLDFVTRHHYTIEPPEDVGHYGYPKLRESDESLKELQASRDVIDSFPEFRGMEMHITEFNSSYSPNTPLHDTNRNAAYIASLLARLGETSASYSYWTFGDIFEEAGVPFTPFHGGFGLVANGLIPKPTFWTFNFFKRLKGDCVHKSGDSVIVRATDGTYCGTAWHKTLREGSKTPLNLDFVLPVTEGEYALTLKLVDEDTCNPLKIWHDIGEPASPSTGQIALLREAAKPFVTTRRITANDGTLAVSLSLKENAVAYFEVSKVDTSSDRGFDYERSVRGE